MDEEKALFADEVTNEDIDLEQLPLEMLPV